MARSVGGREAKSGRKAGIAESVNAIREACRRIATNTGSVPFLPLFCLIRIDDMRAKSRQALFRVNNLLSGFSSIGYDLLERYGLWRVKIIMDHLRSSTHGQATGYSMSVVDVNF